MHHSQFAQPSFLGNMKTALLEAPQKPMTSEAEMERFQSNYAQDLALRIRTLHYRQLVKTFSPPPRVKVQRMRKRFDWFWKQIGAAGIQCKMRVVHPDDTLDEIYFFLISISNSMKPRWYNPVCKTEYTDLVLLSRDFCHEYNVSVESRDVWNSTFAWVRPVDMPEVMPRWVSLDVLVPWYYRSQWSRPEEANFDLHWSCIA